MAVAPTGAIYKALEFDGVSSRTYGVYITGEAVYNAPERDVEMIAIPGRNGSFALDKGRFENIEVSYPAGIFADAESDFAEAVSDFRNFLCSRNGYVRLQDEYNPNEYRMAVYKSGLEVTPAQLKAGEFNIVFECKPQRWLTSGESAVTVGEWSDWETESGPIVEIEASETDKIKSLSVALEPIQDLHGYDKPWVGGAGKNKINVADISTSTNFYYVEFGTGYELTADQTYTFSADVTSNIEPFTLSVGSGTDAYAVDILSKQNNNNGRVFITFTPTSAQLATHKKLFVRVPRYTTQQSLTATIKNIQLEFGSTASSFEPYSNICPISGRTECVTYVSGVNVWDEEWEVGGLNGVGGKYNTSDRIRSKNYIPIIGGATYYRTAPNNIQVWCYDADYNMINAFGWNINTTMTMPQEARWALFQVDPVYGTTYNHDISINYPSTDHDYHAYNGQSYTTDLGRTVYGGTLDVVSGELTLTYGVAVFDGSDDENWTRFSSGSASAYAMRITSADFNIKESVSAEVTATANYLVGIGASATWGNYDGFVSTTSTYPNNIFTGIKSITTVADWKAYLAESPLQVVYELATPQTYQLDPQQIDLLLGTNNVWSDGDVTLEYGQDPNVIVNPTLFEASPLIECKGTGNIYLNSDQITINNLPIGDVSLASAKSSSTDSVSSSFNIDNAALLNPGDTITVASGCSTEVSFSWASSVALQSITPTISGTLPGGQVYGSLLSTTSLKCTTTMEAATFAYGTSSYYESTVSVAFEYLQSGTTYTKTCTYKVSCSYDGSNTITLSITNKTGASPFSFTSASACSLKAIKGTSTRLTTTDTIYIDLDIGEAYIINSGTITSINDIVSMPSKLPTIKPGTNTIIYANTITNLKITPRWWKV